MARVYCDINMSTYIYQFMVLTNNEEKIVEMEIESALKPSEDSDKHTDDLACIKAQQS